MKNTPWFQQTLIDVVPAPIFYKDANCVYIGGNKAFEQYLGLPSEQFVGKTVYDIAPADLAEIYDKADKELLNNPGVQTYEASVVYADGTRHEVIFNKTTFNDAEGNVAGLIGVIQDITGRKRAEESLRLSHDELEKRVEERTRELRQANKKLQEGITELTKAETELQKGEQIYRTIINNIRDTFYRTDKTGLLIMVSPSGVSMFGYDTLEEIVGKLTAASFYKDPSERERLMEKMKKDGFVKDHELTLCRKDGSTIPISLSSTRYTDSNGEFAGFEGFIRDISERKQLEEGKLKTQKLEAIGTLAGGIAHDFNNLLQGVYGYISLAKMKWDDKEKCRAAFEQAEKALHRTVKLTNQLLTFSKGGKPIKKPVDLLPVIENAAKFALSGSRSDYHIIADEDISLADADDGQIGQVIQNIVLNADQSMPAGGTVEIVIRNIQAPGKNLPQGLEKGNYIEIAIKDSGIGIAKEYLGRIFDPYFTMKEKGSGLGLATSYSIIKNHRGLIDVKSIVGKGTVFFIYLYAIGKKQKKEPELPAKAVASVRAANVLIMDDDRVVLDVAGELLRELGHEVEFAAQGKEAIDKYQTAKQSGKPFDFVILDLTIRGGMGGAETIKILREIDPAVKAVVSSGYSDNDDVSAYHQLGFSAFLMKPYDADTIQNIINKVLGS